MVQIAYKRIKGIYVVTNKETGKKYVGKSLNIKVRWSRHKYNLRDNIHWNIEMQQDYNFYGDDIFNFEIIHEMPLSTTDEVLCEMEVEYIEKLNTFNDGYNETLGGIGNKGRTFSEEARANMGSGLRGKNHTEESKASISKNKKKRFYIDGELFLGMDATAEKLGISKYQLLKRLRSDDYPNYTY